MYFTTDCKQSYCSCNSFERQSIRETTTTDGRGWCIIDTYYPCLLLCMSCMPLPLLPPLLLLSEILPTFFGTYSTHKWNAGLGQTTAQRIMKQDPYA